MNKYTYKLYCSQSNHNYACHKYYPPIWNQATHVCSEISSDSYYILHAEWFHFIDVCLQSWKGGDGQNASLANQKAKLPHQKQGLPDLVSIVIFVDVYMLPVLTVINLHKHL